MPKISNCKELNPFDHLYILEHLENIQLDNYINNNKLNNYTTIKLQSKKYQNNYCIIHKSTKKKNTIQLSYFDNKGAYADKERLTLKDALKEIYKFYEVKEAI